MLLVVTVVFCIAWGAAGHQKISYNIFLFMNSEMSQFSDWPNILAYHSSDADDRKKTDPSESPKHYIDIDNYYEFVSTGKIPQTIDSAESAHNYYFVHNNGILPWATKASFDSLKACFLRYDWSHAEFFAADLGHYVADGHMPLHITKDYNGRPPNGIHSRYESKMIKDHLDEIVYTGGSVSVIPDVSQYIFNYIYTNHNYVDTILAADDSAQSISSNTSSSQYNNALWQQTKGLTIRLFRNASHALTELIYTAWVQAGSPLISETSVTSEKPVQNVSLEQNFPNPFGKKTQIRYTLTCDSEICIRVEDVTGRRVKTIVNGFVEKGFHTLEWHPVIELPGNYFLIIQSGKYRQVRKMLYIP